MNAVRSFEPHADGTLVKTRNVMLRNPNREFIVPVPYDRFKAEYGRWVRSPSLRLGPGGDILIELEPELAEEIYSGIPRGSNLMQGF